MTRPAPGSAGLVIVGVSHKTAPASLRDRLFADEAVLPALLEDLKAAEIGQAVLLSTCDRTEVQAVAGDSERTAAAITAFLATRAGVAPSELIASGYRLEGDAALRHLFAVASSLDSAVVGEPQILGQLKNAHRIAAAAGLVGPELERVLQAAYGAAKRVRSETGIAERAVSIAAVARELVGDLHGELSRCAGLIVGAGEMGEFLAEHLRQSGLVRWTVGHPSIRRAELVAHRFGAHFVGLDELPGALSRADLVIAALGAGRIVIDKATVDAALRARRQHPILIIDVAVPPDVATDVADVEQAFLYDLGDLERLALEGRAGRAAAAADAWAIVDAELASFRATLASRAAVPALVALRRRFEAARAEVLAAGGLDAAEATRRLVNRILHEPSQTLRRLAENGQSVEAEALLRRLFGLDGQLVDREGEDKESDA